MRIYREIQVVEDGSRLETFPEGEGSARKLVLSIYYLASADEITESEAGMKYTEMFRPCEANAIGILKDIGMNMDLLNDCATEVCNAKPAQKLSGAHPVMIYSPALGLDRDMYMYNIQELVYQGFVIITISVLYEAMFTVLPDGEFVHQSEVMHHIDTNYYTSLQHLIEIRKKDIQFLLDYLNIMNATDEMLKGNLELDAIAVTGHSLGGIAALETAWEDERIQACILLDPSMDLFREECVRRGNLPPTLVLTQEASNYEHLKQILGEETAAGFLKGQQQLAQRLEGLSMLISVPDASHMSFSDLPLFEEDILLNHRTQEIHKIINGIQIRFLKNCLSGE